MLKTVVSMRPAILWIALLIGLAGHALLLMRESGKSKFLSAISTPLLHIIAELFLLLGVIGLVGQMMLRSIVMTPSPGTLTSNNAPVNPNSAVREVYG